MQHPSSIRLSDAIEHLDKEEAVTLRPVRLRVTKDAICMTCPMGWLAFDDLDTVHILAMFQRCRDLSGQKIRRTQAQQRMFAKLAQHMSVPNG